MKHKFYNFVEKKKKYHVNVYTGIIVSENKKEWTVIAQGPDNGDSIKTIELAKNEYVMEPIDEFRAKSYFDVAVLKADKKVIDAEFEVEENKINKSVQDHLYCKVFPE